MSTPGAATSVGRTFAAAEFAAGAARAPVPLLGRTKETLRQVPWQPDFEAAIATEVTHQAWSLGQGWFKRPV